MPDLPTITLQKVSRITVGGDYESAGVLEWHGTLKQVKAESKVLETLHTHAGAHLGTGAYYEVRATIPADFGRQKHLCWYSSPWMEKKVLRVMKPKWVFDVPRGVYILGRWRVK